MDLHAALLTLLVCYRANALPVLKPLTGRKENVHVKRTDNIHVSSSRVPGCYFPSLMQFRFPVNGSDVILNLEKHHRISTSSPIYVTVKGTIQKMQTNSHDNVALYQDINRGSAMLVSCENNGYFLHGSFRHNGVMYHMSPHNTALSDWSTNHFVQRHKENTDKYAGDMIRVPNEQISAQRQWAAGRNKRAMPTGNVVELLMCPDVTVYDYFLREMGTEAAAETALQLYMALLANEIDLVYSSVVTVDPNFSIEIYLAGIVIAKTDTDAKWSLDSQANINGIHFINMNGGALHRFRQWHNPRVTLLPPHDHAMAFSMLDMAHIYGGVAYTGIEGQAYMNAVCGSYGLSMVEIDGNRVSSVAAHELAHNLGSDHDGNPTRSSSCPYTDQNIMTNVTSTTVGPSFASAQWRFSKCSVAMMKDYISGLEYNCLQQNSFIKRDIDTLPAHALPGSEYSIDQQCQLYNGPASSSCQAFLADDDCHNGFQCENENGCTGSFFPLYPLSGTPCSSSPNMWCLRGQCVKKPGISSHPLSHMLQEIAPPPPLPHSTSKTMSSAPSAMLLPHSNTPVTALSASLSRSSKTPLSSRQSPYNSATLRSTLSPASLLTKFSARPTTTYPVPHSLVPKSTPKPAFQTCYRGDCCVIVGKGSNQQYKCCAGSGCCVHNWSKRTLSFQTCCKDPSLEPGEDEEEEGGCFKSRCCVANGKGKNKKLRCCVGVECCRFDWADTTRCVRTCCGVA